MDDLELNIYTAKFIKFDFGDKVILEVRVGKNKTEIRKFDSSSSLMYNIENPKNVLIGILTKPGTITTTFINGNRYHKLFEECGWELSFEEQTNENRRKRLKKVLTNPIETL